MENASKIENGSLTITRFINAPQEKVWKAFTDPEEMKKWWGPQNWSAPTVKIDFKVGGKYLLCMRGSMGPGQPEIDTWSAGIYEEIVPMEKIVVMDFFSDDKGNKINASVYGLPDTFPMESKIIFTFEEIESGTMKFTLHYPSISGIEGKMQSDMVQGWNQSLDKLEAALK